MSFQRMVVGFTAIVSKAMPVTKGLDAMVDLIED